LAISLEGKILSTKTADLEGKTRFTWYYSAAFHCGWGWGAPALKGPLSWLDVLRAGLLPAAAFPAAGSTW